MNWRVWLLLGVVLAAIVAIFFVPPIPQSEAYHNFADQRTILAIPNFLNTISNLPFLYVGLLGVRFVLLRSDGAKPAFVERTERWPYLIFFLAVTLTAFGSAWYHLRPNDETLVWDRLPMAVGFMSLVAAMVCERISVKTGIRLLVPLILFGAASVIYWSVTQTSGHGDLRPYALAQFGSLLVLLLLVALFAPRYTRGADLIVSLGFYGLAKILEATDRPVFAFGGIMSGHTLKHIAAAVSAYWVLRMLQLRAPSGVKIDSVV
jgi:hypothetical protein